MKAHLLKNWDLLRSSFWFLPALMALAAVALAFGTVYLDRTMPGHWVARLQWLYAGGADGAGAILEVVAGSMMTIAGVVFSMTLVAMTLASSQFGPRLLRNFMRDTSNQMVLGTFIATFLYALLVLRTIRREDEATFVPQLSVTVALALALASMAVLIYFIHHVAISIQADHIVARVGGELDECIQQLFPEQTGDGRTRAMSDVPVEETAALARADSHGIDAPQDGYLQYIDGDLLLALATEADLVIHMAEHPGQYVTRGRPVLLVSPRHRVVGKLAAKLEEAIIVGNERTPAQDVEFSVNQLVEMAVRALSPGINDPFTAIRCVDRLGSALYRLAQKAMPSPLRFDGESRLRIISRTVTFEAVLAAAFTQIRQHAVSSPAVSIRLLEALAMIAEAAGRPEDRKAVQLLARQVAGGATLACSVDEDREALQARYREVCLRLQRPGAQSGFLSDSMSQPS